MTVQEIQSLYEKEGTIDVGESGCHKFRLPNLGSMAEETPLFENVSKQMAISLHNTDKHHFQVV